MPANIQRGHSHPLGATLRGDGANFSVYALGAERVELLLFDRPSDERPARVISLDADNHHTFRYWHAHVGGVAAGQAYGYRVFGPHTDAGKVLLDPYARAVDVARWDRAAASRGGDNCATAPRGVLVDPHDYDWEGDRPLQRPIQQTVIYELHVRGFTVHPSSGVSTPNRGTFSGLVEKIPYLVDLGITAVELMPVMQFDAQEAPKGRTNYWGYCPMSWFAPHSGYASRPGATAVLDEFRAMVKAFHRAGIEVILDVVYNHTAEGGRRGPTFSWRGLADDTYYLHDHDGGYADFTGTGNTIKADHPVTRRMLFDSLVYWVEEMHVDGFRFDLASVLARDATGEPLPDPQLIRAIESHPVLAGTKMIAEAWDAAGLFQVGSFAGDRWHEWNAHYRDDLRRYLRGDPGSARSFVARLLGSPDIYGHEEREPEQSINFVTCHDGFPLADVVAYSRKHNLDNGEQDRDGLDENFSWNCGVEGSTDDLEIDLRRLRHGKSLLALLLLSLGTPMLSMGDELRRTQRGNNNAYCQDNEVSWLDWDALQRDAGLHRFVRATIRLRAELVDNGHRSLHETLQQVGAVWRDPDLAEPDWDGNPRCLAGTLRAPDGGTLLHWMINAGDRSCDFALPEPPAGQPWRRVLDSSLESPEDCCPGGDGEPIAASHYRLAAFSVALVRVPTTCARSG